MVINKLGNVLVIVAFLVGLSGCVSTSIDRQNVLIETLKKSYGFLYVCNDDYTCKKIPDDTTDPNKKKSQPFLTFELIENSKSNANTEQCTKHKLGVKLKTELQEYEYEPGCDWEITEDACKVHLMVPAISVTNTNGTAHSNGHDEIHDLHFTFLHLENDDPLNKKCSIPTSFNGDEFWIFNYHIKHRDQKDIDPMIRHNRTHGGGISQNP